MSRTFKDRPDWVKKNDPAFRPFIDHNHRTGECIEETFDDMRRVAGGQNWNMSSKHNRVCNKIIRTTWFCTRKDPYISPYGYRRCWVTFYTASGHIAYRGCGGHIKETPAPDEPCSCDRHPDPIRTTCDITLPRSVGRGEIHNNYRSRSKENNSYFTRPTRARVRDDLRGMVVDYNSNGDLSDVNEDYDGSWEHNIPWWHCCSYCY